MVPTNSNRSLSCSSDALLKASDDGAEVVEELEGAAGKEFCEARKPTSAISATAAKAPPPAASSKSENGFGAKDFITPRSISPAQAKHLRCGSPNGI
ncbi:MAG TPA: hypothetical protein VGJ20_11910 [Xanthobacteraceae bacterium]